ncbi:unnamed protein product, partial [Brenthis ino]
MVNNKEAKLKETVATATAAQQCDSQRGVLATVIRASHASRVDSGHRPASASIIQHATPPPPPSPPPGQRTRTATPTGPPLARRSVSEKPEARKAKTKHTYLSLQTLSFRAVKTRESARWSRVT